MIRDIVRDLWRRRMGGKGWVRDCWDPPLAIIGRGVDVART